MRSTYAVVWREGAGPLARGRLELLSFGLRLDGVAGCTHVRRAIPYDELAAVRIGRSNGDRLNGHPSLVIDRVEGEPIVLASVALQGAVAELADHLAGRVVA
jgi:hypothetical protein